MPASLRSPRDLRTRLALSKLLLGMLTDDLLPSIHHSNMDDIIKGGETGFALDFVDPRRLAEGKLDSEEARNVAEALWLVASARGWNEHYDVGNVTASTVPLEVVDTSTNDGQFVATSRQYRDSELSTTERTSSPTTTLSALGSVTLSARSVAEETVADDATITGSYRGVGVGGYLGFTEDSTSGWIPHNNGDDMSWDRQRQVAANSSSGRDIPCACSEDGNPDSTIDIITSSFSHSSSSIPVRYDGWLRVVELDEELRNFEAERSHRQATSETYFLSDSVVSTLRLTISTFLFKDTYGILLFVVCLKVPVIR